MGMIISENSHTWVVRIQDRLYHPCLDSEPESTSFKKIKRCIYGTTDNLIHAINVKLALHWGRSEYQLILAIKNEKGKTFNVCSIRPKILREIYRHCAEDVFLNLTVGIVKRITDERENNTLFPLLDSIKNSGIQNDEIILATEIL